MFAPRCSSFARLLFLVASAVLSPGAQAAPESLAQNAPVRPVRERLALSQWQFAPEQSPPVAGAQLAVPEKANWCPVTVPHIFRQSGLPDESAGWYRTTLKPSVLEKGESFYLVLEGAASVKNVFVNGQQIGEHKGAYSRAAFDLTPALRFGRDNFLAVRVSNRSEEAQNCFSRSTLYYVNGGMFRPAWLVKTGAVHLYPDMGSTGLYLTPKGG